MKKILLAALLVAFAFPIIAQQVMPPSGGGRGNVVSTDTIRISRYAGSGALYFEVRTQKFNSDVNEVTTKLPLGSSSTEALLALSNQTVRETAALAEHMRQAALRTEVLNAALQRDKATSDTLGTSFGLLRNLKDTYKSTWIGTGWSFKTASGTVYSGCDIIDNTGTDYLRITINSVNYDVIVFGADIIRIRNYPSSGKNTDLVYVKSNDYREVPNADGGARLYK